MKTQADQFWAMWPSIIEYFELGDARRPRIATQLEINGRRYDIDVEQGPDRPPNCPATCFEETRWRWVCALTPFHDGPHVGASEEYMQLAQITITGMRTPA